MKREQRESESKVEEVVTTVKAAVETAVPKVSLCKGKDLPEKKAAPAKKEGVSGFDGSWDNASPLDEKK